MTRLRTRTISSALTFRGDFVVNRFRNYCQSFAAQVCCMNLGTALITQCPRGRQQPWRTLVFSGGKKAIAKISVDSR